MTGVSGAAASSVPGSAFADIGTDALAGPSLAAALAAVDITALDDHDLVEYVRATERLAAWSASLQLGAAAEFARRPLRMSAPGDDPVALAATYAPAGRWVREHADDELAVALRISRQAAASRIGLACALATLPATAAALRSGSIDVSRARVVVDETAALDRSTAREVETDLAQRAPRCTARRLRERARAAVLAVDPAAAHVRHLRARAERTVVISPLPDGMAELWARLTAHEAAAIDAALNADARASRAQRTPGDERTMDQRRADAFVAALADNHTGTGGGGTGGGPGPGTSGAGAGVGDGDGAGQSTDPRSPAGVEIQVTVAASTLLGHDDLPAHLRGYGPITAEVARGLAADARWRRVLTGPAGAVIDVSPTTYRPGAALTRFVQTRTPTCSFPGCAWPARACDLDHAVPFPDGDTTAANLGPLCRRHHRLKTRGAVRVTQDPDGTRHWTLPTGHQHTARPPAIGPPTPQPPTLEPSKPDEPPP